MKMDAPEPSNLLQNCQKLKPFKKNGLLSSLPTDLTEQKLFLNDVSRIPKECFTNGLILELQKYSKDNRISNSQLIAWIQALAPADFVEDSLNSNSESIRLKISDLKKKFDKFTSSKNKQSREDLMNDIFEFPEMSKTKHLKPEEKYDSKITTVIKGLVDENRGLKRGYKQLEEDNEMLSEYIESLELSLYIKENEYTALVEEAEKQAKDFNNVLKRWQTDSEFLEKNAMQMAKIIQNMKKTFESKTQAIENMEKVIADLKKKISHQKTKNENRRMKRAKMTAKNAKEKVKEKEQELQTVQEELNQSLRELEICRETLEDKEKEKQELNNQIESLRAEKNRLSKKVWYYKNSYSSSSVDGFKTKLEESERELATMVEEVKKINAENLQLQQFINLMEDNEIITFKEGKYTNEIREVIMELLALNVSMNKVNDVIRVVLKKLANKEVSHLPSKGLKSKLLAEANYIASVQVAEAMINGADFSDMVGNCRHQDGTSKFSRHYQNFQITTKEGRQYTAGLLEMGRSDAQAIFESFELKMKLLSKAICTHQNSDIEKITSELTCSIKNTMGDQGPTNPSFNAKILEKRSELIPAVIENWDGLSEDSQEQILNMGNFWCKLHLIANFGSEAENALRLFENTALEGKNPYSFGSTSGTVRLVREATKAVHPRGSDEAGKADYFAAYLEGLGCKLQIVPMQGSRINIIFYNAAAVYYHKEHIKAFLKDWPKPNNLLLSVNEDIKEDVYLAGLRALGLINKFITGPLWRILEKEGTGILDINDDLYQLQIQLERLHKDASSLLNGEALFDDVKAPIHKDVLYESLLREGSPQFDALTQSALEIICGGLLLILERQAKDQLPGGKYWNPDDQLIHQASNVPTTNTISERDFAQLDILLRIKPFARIQSLESLIMWVNNKTPDWLNSLPLDKKNKLLDEARHSSDQFLNSYRDRVKIVFEEKKAALLRKQQEKADDEAKKIQIKIELTGKINDLGGLWKSEEEIERNCTTLREAATNEFLEKEFEKAEKRANSKKGKSKARENTCVNNQKLEERRNRFVDSKIVDAFYIQLQFYKLVLETRGERELFQKSFKRKDTQHTFNSTEMKDNLLKIINLNKIQSEKKDKAEKESVKQKPEEERKRLIQAEKAKLKEKLEMARKKREDEKIKNAVLKTKSKLNWLIENPHELVNQTIKYQCQEEDGSSKGWYIAEVKALLEDGKDSKDIRTINYQIHFEVDDDEDDLWTFPLLEDISEGLLIWTEKQ